MNLTTTTWLPGAPAHVSPETQQIDREVLASAECEECGTLGLAYRPERRGQRYRALAVCPCCQRTQEF